MKKKILKQILLKYYKEPSMFAILRGIRKPSYEVVVELHKKHNIPFDAWLDIKSYIENDTKNDKETSSANESKSIPKEEKR
jgi:hypothetical protein